MSATTCDTTLLSGRKISKGIFAVQLRPPSSNSCDHGIMSRSPMCMDLAHITAPAVAPDSTGAVHEYQDATWNGYHIE